MNKNSKIILDTILPELYNKLNHGAIINGTVELLNHTTTFEAHSLEDGVINIGNIFVTKVDYIERELAWYNSQSLDTKEIGAHAKIWNMCSDSRGKIKSNYGFLMYSAQNGYQFENVIKELATNHNSRRAVAYYTNPMMHYTGGNDHICTLAVGYRIIDSELHAFVTMRSNDLRFGLIGADLYWQIYMLHEIAKELHIKPAKVHWHAMSLHLYERHFNQLSAIMDIPF